MMKEVQIEDLEDMARGAAFLGTGGGGDPYIGRLVTRETFKEYGPAKVITVDDVKDDALVCCVAGFGAPTVQVEKLTCGDEVEYCFRKLEERLGRKADAILPAEIGGSNSMLPLMLGSRTKLPVVDADGMGRAFPELQMNSLSVHGITACPLVVIDEHKNFATVEATSDRQAEAMTRALAIQMGLRVFIAGFSMSGRQLKEAAIEGTLTLAHGIGCAIRQGRHDGDPVEALVSYLRTTEYYKHAKILFDGKIIDLERKTDAGFSIGHCYLESLDGRQQKAEFVFQNENLVVRVEGKMRAVVPDLITIVDRETAEPIPTQDLKYGQRVKVIGVSAPSKMRSPKALETFGPSAFRLPESFVPIENIS